LSLMKKILLLTAAVLLFSSHELFLKTDSYFLEEDADAVVYLYNGTFDKSENYITSDRIVDAMVIGPGYKTDPAAEVQFRSGNITLLPFTTGSSGTYVAGVSTLPRDIELSAEEFLEYLQHEDLQAMIREREEKGLSGNPAVEKYSKHVKAILQVGDNRSGHWSEKLGYPVEFVPLQNPYLLSEGDSLSLLLLSDGSPLPGQVVHAGTRKDSNDPDRSRNLHHTDSNGVVSVVIEQTGTWFLSTIHMTASTEEGLDYESNWATITFAIQ